MEKAFFQDADAKSPKTPLSFYVNKFRESGTVYSGCQVGSSMEVSSTSSDLVLGC